MAKPVKKVTANLKLRIPAGQASAGPPVGSTLGQHGVNMMDFINPFNEQTKDLRGHTVTVHIAIHEDRSMSWRIVGEATDDLIKKAAGIQKGSGRPHDEKVGKLTRDQIKQIAKSKMVDMNAEELSSAMKQVAGTARSMGIETDLIE
jgi:large subunit ribosomal protein L11